MHSPDQAPAIVDAVRSAARDLTFYWPGVSVGEACERYGLRPEDVIKMASNENAYGSSPQAVAAARAALDHAAGYPSVHYDYAGLKRALGSYAGAPHEMVIPGPGAETVARYITHLCVNPGDEVIMGAQSYDGHRWVSQLMGGVVREVPLVDYRYDLDALLAAITTRTRVIWVCNPINPTGTTLSREQARRFVEAVPPTIAIVFDQAYYEYVDDPGYGDGLELLLGGYNNVIVLRTLSKVFGLASLRIGYALADPALGTIIENTREPFHLSGPGCAAGTAAVTRDLDWAHAHRDLILSERARLQDALTALGLGVVPSQGNFVLFDVGVDTMDLYERLMSHGIILRLGHIWYYPTHLRATVGRPEHNDRLVAALAHELGRSPQT